MSEFVVYGIPGSPYLRSALLGFHEKQAPYRLAVLAGGSQAGRSEEHLQRHPFGRIPVMDHGEFRLYETQAILRYLDAILPESSWQPRDPRTAARMNQIVGIVDWYIFPYVSVGITAERCLSQLLWNRAPNEENIAKALPQARVCIRELERLQGSAEYLAGDNLSIADLMVAPHLLLFRRTPEAQELMSGTALEAWLVRMSARLSVKATETEQLRSSSAVTAERDSQRLGTNRVRATHLAY